MTAGPQAWHEAGHALAAHLMGGRVREVTLESELEGLEGHVAVEWRPEANTAQDARRLAAVALAGPVAELVFQGEALLDDPTALNAWRGDWDEAEAQLARVHAEWEAQELARREILAELKRAFESTDGYERLARVADALEAHGTLDDVLFEDVAG